MKAKNLILLLPLIILCTSCTITYDEPPYYSHSLHLYFQDASGTDLLKGIDTERWKEPYILRPVYSEPCMWESGSVSLSEITEMNDRYYLYFSFIGNKGRNCPNPAREISLQERWPDIFGDSDPHKIETYWIQKDAGLSEGSKCYRIVIDDKEITDITYEKAGPYTYNETISIATITLEK